MQPLWAKALSSVYDWDMMDDVDEVTNRKIDATATEIDYYFPPITSHYISNFEFK